MLGKFFNILIIYPLQESNFREDYLVLAPFVEQEQLVAFAKRLK